MNHTAKRPLRGFVLLGTVSLAVVAGAAAWLQVGWRSLGLQLTDHIGDGKIFVLDLQKCIRVRTRETGPDAIG